MNNVICVKWGTLYGPEFVNRLYAMVHRNVTMPFRFICLADDTDGIRSEVETFPIEPGLKGWWPKVQYFKSPLYDVEGTVLALDLDILIVDNIDCFFTYKPNQLCMKDDFRGHGHSSCVMKFTANDHPQIYDNFNPRKINHSINNVNPNFKNTKYWGDQIWITEQGKKDPHKRKIGIWPNDWIIKWKHKWTMYPVEKFPGKILVWAGHMKDQRMVPERVKNIWHEGL